MAFGSVLHLLNDPPCQHSNRGRIVKSSLSKLHMNGVVP
jgi:hypothetical protein